MTTQGDKKGYALDMVSPVRHVANRMEGAAPAALSIQQLADGYHHPNPSDLARVQHHEGAGSKQEAVIWLIRRAVTEIERRGKTGAVQVVADNGGFRFADGVSLDSLRWQGKKVDRLPPPSILNEPFDPMSGKYSEHVGIKSRRLDTRHESLAELRESMRLFGWIEELPAIKDERGVVIVGHRRLAVAAELDIPPVVRTIKVGQGDEADARRLKLALASNLGAKPFTPEERRDFAEYLYGEKDWTMQQIADALNVAQSTVSEDLRFIGADKSTARGRPRNLMPEQEDELLTLHEQGLTQAEAEAKVRGWDEPKPHLSTTGRKALAAAQARREERAAAAVETRPTCTCPNCGHAHTPG
jgi:ParB-like chromosome segregation protein Spo0J